MKLYTPPPPAPDYVRVIIERQKEPRKVFYVLGTDYMAVSNKMQLELRRTDIAERTIGHGHAIKVQCRQTFGGKNNGKSKSFRFYSQLSVEEVNNHFKQIFE